MDRQAATGGHWLCGVARTLMVQAAQRTASCFIPGAIALSHPVHPSSHGSLELVTQGNIRRERLKEEDHLRR